MIGAQGIAQRFVAPLTQRLGDLWCEGKITAVHEHFANGHIRAFVSNLAQPFAGAEAGPALVVATPSGQLHEMARCWSGRWPPISAGRLFVSAPACLRWNRSCSNAGPGARDYPPRLDVALFYPVYGTPLERSRLKRIARWAAIEQGKPGTREALTLALDT